jgi:hypothetical protein
MSVEDVRGIDIGFVAGASFASNQYKFAEKSTADDGKVTLSNGAGGLCVGVIQDNPESGGASRVRISGTTWCVAGATITANSTYMSDASGTATAVTSGLWMMGIALTACASGEQFVLQLAPNYKGF